MSEASAIRYLMSKGWSMVEDGWFSLTGQASDAVCVETAFYHQRRLDMASA